MTANETASPALRDLARAYGVSTEYHGWKGGLVQISEATLRAVLAALGADVSEEAAVERSLRDMDEKPWRRILPPVVVCREGDPADKFYIIEKGRAGVYIGDNPQASFRRNHYPPADDLQWVRGNHTLAFGFHGELAKVDVLLAGD